MAKARYGTLAKKRMRLDLSSFQRTRRAGLIVVLVLVIGFASSIIVADIGSSVAEYYLRVEEYEIPNKAAFERIIGSGEPVAVMFESPTCPTCKRMHPYWAELEKASDKLPVKFYHIVFDTGTREVFAEYRVEETPTFIVFVNGKPVARHIGSFEGDNVTRVMLAWALGAAGLGKLLEPKELAEEGLSLFNKRCSECHGRIEGLDKPSLERWLSQRSLLDDYLAKALMEAVSSNKTLSEAYGGYDLLSDAVASMRKYLPDLSSEEVDKTSYLLEYISSVLLGRGPPRIAQANVSIVGFERGGEATPLEEAAAHSSPLAPGLVGLAAAFVAGVVAAFSPCVLPILVMQAGVAARSGGVTASSCALCGVASFVGVMAIASLFVAAGSLAAPLQELLTPTIAVLVAAIGVSSLLGVPVEIQNLFGARSRGLLGFCGVYGLLAVQCNLPLVVGALLLVAGLGNVYTGLMVAVGFAAGISLPVAAVVYASARLGSGLADRVLARSELLARLGGAVLLASGLYLLAYHYQLI